MGSKTVACCTLTRQFYYPCIRLKMQKLDLKNKQNNMHLFFFKPYRPLEQIKRISQKMCPF